MYVLTVFSELPIAKINITVTSKIQNIFSANISRSTVLHLARVYLK